MRRNVLGEALHLVPAVAAFQRYNDMQTFPARRLHEGVEAELIEQRARQLRRRHDLRPRQLRIRVEVEHHRVGALESGCF